MVALLQRAQSADSRELRIMALWDDGRSVQQIAHQIDVSTKKVTDIVSTYNDPGEHRIHCRHMAAGSAALRAALNNARGAHAHG